MRGPTLRVVSFRHILRRNTLLSATSLARFRRRGRSEQRRIFMTDTVTTKDGVSIYFKDWGPKAAQPIVFHHVLPLSPDDWVAQMLFFLSMVYRVVAHDRLGHGRSTQVSDGRGGGHY